MNGYLIWWIFGVVILLLIVFFVYSAVKDARAKKKRKRKEIEFKNDAARIKTETVLKLDLLLKKNQDLLDNFKPSIGDYKMSQIVNTARKYLLDLQQTPEFKEFIVNNTDCTDLFKNFVVLRDTRSSVWNKANTVLEYLKEEKLLIDLENKKEDIVKFESEIEEYYKNEV
ncbi:hypothetical protein KQ872_02940 [Mycoplasma sp. ES3225-GEN-MYC]|uniref:Uncharacterized protein n=1 Tax=Mycoplasma miroungigenitalium TaxID=754515 RepID=A0A6M4JFE0_9MOLU|nr:hypothetical protein [Mycoplasma miroungigenitalium]MBU4691906.1 hypothetical protein [Mycoplasma miroungigenitalium]QJR43762.1 hypothetical protein HLA87_03165 [Mycoplasma miroungigenitalium]